MYVRKEDERKRTRACLCSQGHGEECGEERTEEEMDPRVAYMHARKHNEDKTFCICMDMIEKDINVGWYSYGAGACIVLEQEAMMSIREERERERDCAKTLCRIRDWPATVMV